MIRPSTSQGNAAYLDLEHRLVTLQFRPGGLYTEKAIVEIVGLGRTPVREAIQRFAWEGFMEVHPRLGVKIAEIRPEDYPRAIEPRLTLEPLLARSAARYGGPEAKENIAEAMQEILVCAERGDVTGYLQQDKALDEALSAAAANPFLPRILAPLQIHSRRFWYHYHGAEDLTDAARAHAAMSEAVVTGDAEAAFSAARALMEYMFEQSRKLAHYEVDPA
jgi:DNA-binding GntR family transcriptional regulator